MSGSAPGLISPTRILLVEDNPAFAALVAALLVDGGVEADLEVAGTLAEAIAALHERPADCVLLDLGLPDAELEQTITRMVSMAGPTPVIVLSGHPDPALPDRVRRAGALDFVEKGALDGRVLARLIGHVVAGSRSEAPLPAGTSRPPRAVEIAPAVAAAAAGAVGVLTVIGWAVGAHAVLSWGALPTIKLGAGLALIAAAIAVASLRRPSIARRRVAFAAAAFVGGWAVLTLLEWVLGRSLGIDQLLVHDPATAGVPGRASPHTAIALTFLAGALATLDARAVRLRRLHLLLGGAFLATVVLAGLGWLFGAGALTGHSRVTGMALPSLAGLIALLAGSLCLRPEAPPFTLVRGGSPAALMMRRLIPAALLGPPVLGGLRLLGEQAGLYDGRFGLALFATSMVVALLGLVVATARAVARADDARLVAARTIAESESRFRTLARLAPLGILESDVSGACTNVNPAWCEQTGLAARDAWGDGWIAAVHPEDRDDVAHAWRTAPPEREDLDLEYRILRADGGGRVIQAHRAVLREPGGAITGHQCTTTDVTGLRRAELEARTNQSRLQSSLDHLPLGIYLRGLDQRYQVVNAHFVREFGRPADEIVGKTARELHPDALVEWADELERPIHERGETVSGESAAPHADGTEHYHWVIKYPVTDDNGTVIAVGGAILDITDRRRAELALAAAEAEQAALRRVATAVAEDVGAAVVFEQVAEEVARLLGFEMGAVVRFENDDEASVLGAWTAEPTTTVNPRIKLDGANATSLVARTGRAARFDGYDTATGPANDARAGVAAPITIGGRLWGAVGAATNRDLPLPANAEERVARFADLAATAIGNAEARATLARYAATDALTGLPNYRTFHDRLSAEGERATRHGRRLSLILLDIDRFKSINDEHGHSVGDEVLAETARRLTAHMRGSDLVARVGGEEFAWLLPETDAAGAYVVAERARNAIQRQLFDSVGTVTVSAGVCSLEESGDAQSLIRLADRAMYWAKESGRNTTFRYTEAARAALSGITAQRRI